MEVKGILLNPDMVRAILDGRKTVTRQVIKGRVPLNNWQFYELHDNKDGAITCGRDKLCAGFYTDRHIFYIDGEKHIDAHYYIAPYKPGDILYVRETWNETSDLFGEFPQYIYRADFSEEELETVLLWHSKWHPSIYMPKEAARIWLKVTDVRVERLQDMWASDVSKEGILFERPYAASEMLKKFAQLWDSTIKKKGLPFFRKYRWKKNPWVWVIEFERTVKPKEDA